MARKKPILKLSWFLLHLVTFVLVTLVVMTLHVHIHLAGAGDEEE